MDDDGKIEDLLEDDFIPAAPNLEEEKTNFILNSIYSIQYVFETYGWFILIGSLLVYYLYTKYKNKLSSLRTSYVSSHRNIDEEVELRRLRNIEIVRQKQQAALDAAAAKYLEEKRRKEEELAQKRLEELEKLQQGLGYRSKTKKPEESELSSLGLSQRPSGQPKPKLRGTDYNPLTGQDSSGSSGGACFRPSRRNTGRGG